MTLQDGFDELSAAARSAGTEAGFDIRVDALCNKRDLAILRKGVTIEVDRVNIIVELSLSALSRRRCSRNILCRSFLKKKLSARQAKLRC